MIDKHIVQGVKALFIAVAVSLGGSWWIAYSEGAAHDIRVNIFFGVMIVMTLCMTYAAIRPFFSIAAANLSESQQ